MTKEEKDLLLKDLCARLPYGVIVRVCDKEWGDFDSYVDSISNTCIETHPIEDLNFNPYVFYKLEDIKPYLRPMSSMTDDEWEEYNHLKMEDWVMGDIYGVFYNAGTITDWLNKYMFDYRGLIPMGLALEASEGMYKIEENGKV